MRFNHCVACAVAALALAAGGAWSAPDEDYAAGRKAYFEGDMAGATTLLTRSADAGHAPAQALLARLLRRIDLTDAAVGYYRQSAAQGYAEAEYELGAMYAAGDGVKPDSAEARRWLARAADNGHRLAITALADAYLDGGLGLDEQERTGPAAAKCLQRAAETGHVRALERLAAAYRNGGLGLPVDARQAEQLEARARSLRGGGAQARAGKEKAK